MLAVLLHPHPPSPVTQYSVQTFVPGEKSFLQDQQLYSQDLLWKITGSLQPAPIPDMGPYVLSGWRVCLWSSPAMELECMDTPAPGQFFYQ